MPGGDPASALSLESGVRRGLERAGEVGVNTQGGRVVGVLRDAGVLADGQTEPPSVDFERRGSSPGVKRFNSTAPNHILWYATLAPLAPIASIAMCDFPASPSTGAPTSANEPIPAQASTMGARFGSSTPIAGASSSYPVKKSSGKTTTRVRARQTVAAAVNALAATSYDTHGGWATATVSGSRMRTPPHDRFTHVVAFRGKTTSRLG